MASFFPPGREDNRHHCARVIWSSLHGMVSLEIGGKLVATEPVVIAFRRRPDKDRRLGKGGCEPPASRGGGIQAQEADRLAPPVAL